jgi:hypothetical protein
MESMIDPGEHGDGYQAESTFRGPAQTAGLLVLDLPANQRFHFIRAVDRIASEAERKVNALFNEMQKQIAEAAKEKGKK